MHVSQVVLARIMKHYAESFNTERANLERVVWSGIESRSPRNVMATNARGSERPPWTCEPSSACKVLWSKACWTNTVRGKGRLVMHCLEWRSTDCNWGGADLHVSYCWSRKDQRLRKLKSPCCAKQVGVSSTRFLGKGHTGSWVVEESGCKEDVWLPGVAWEVEKV